MPRQQARKQLLNFVGGLITEASPLSFPENTAKDIDNLNLNRDGSVQRRKGLDFEVNSQYSQIQFPESTFETDAISQHEWESVDGDDTLNFTAIQVGGDLYFHKLGEQTLSTSVLGYISLAPISTRTDYRTYTVSTSTGKGKLFVCSPAISPCYIQYDADTGVFTGVKLTLQIRDTDGIDEEDDSPIVFGDDITPSGGTDPVDDFNDIITGISDPNNFFPFIDINPGSA